MIFISIGEVFVIISVSLFLALVVVLQVRRRRKGRSHCSCSSACHLASNSCQGCHIKEHMESIKKDNQI